MQLEHLQSYNDFMPRLNESYDMDMEAREKVKLAIGLVLINLPFFAPLLIRLWVFEDKKCKTMYTNGKSIAYGPEFVKSLKVGEIAWVLVHEIMHNVLLHFSRMRPNAKLWNIATDYAINLLIKDVSDSKTVNDRFVMPTGGLYDEKYKGMSADAIYDHLEKNPDEQPDDFNNPGGVTDETMEIDPDSVCQSGDSNQINDEEDGDDSDGGGGSGEEGEEKEGGKKGAGAGEEGEEDENGKPAKPKPVKMKGKPGGKIVLPKASESEINSAVSQAISKASGAIRRYYDEMFKPKIDWKKELKKYIKEIFDKIKYKMPYRRFAHAGQYLTGPVRKGEELNNIVVAIDTSGSIDNEMVNQFLAEVAGIIQAYQIQTLYVISIDDKIRTVNKFKSPRDLKTLKVDIKGGGGTDFIPVFTWLKSELSNKFSLLVYITDAYGSFPSPAPTYKDKVIWCVKGPGTVPFGKRISLGD